MEQVCVCPLLSPIANYLSTPLVYLYRSLLHFYFPSLFLSRDVTDVWCVRELPRLVCVYTGFFPTARPVCHDRHETAVPEGEVCVFGTAAAAS